MTASQPLTGVELVNCARANARQGLAIAAKLCGYGTDGEAFERELAQACQAMGLARTTLGDLAATPTPFAAPGRAIAPETDSQL